MTYIVLGIFVLVGIVSVFTIFSKEKDKPTNEEKEEEERPSDCCGAHEICEVELKKLSRKIEYFDDEELDKYKHKGELEYQDNEIEDFRDILYTLKRMKFLTGFTVLN